MQIWQLLSVKHSDRISRCTHLEDKVSASKVCYCAWGVESAPRQSAETVTVLCLKTPP